MAFQKEVWKAYGQGKHGLLNAPTGSGKTYALWIPIAMECHRLIKNKGLKAIWITPLRALAQEIGLACQKFSDDNQLQLKVGIRTGDTTLKEREQQKKQLPDLLITTPESLHLLLARKGSNNFFKNLTAIVIDEWHELLGSKRGVQVELALSRLKGLKPQLKIWGISATIGNLEEAAAILIGTSYKENCEIIRTSIKKKLVVQTIIPKEIEKYPWAGHLGIKLLEDVLPIVRASRSTLIFTNTRAQSEIWYQRLLDAAPDLVGLMALHHGSISKELRLWVEDSLRAGKLKVVICTSSLDLGVDFSPVETVIQVGSPKGVARFIQRAGRSGHQPGKRSVIHFLPTHALELIEASALKEAVNEGVIEDRVPYIRSFDVLIQYLITLALGEGFKADQVFSEVKNTFSYASISEEEWKWTLNFIGNGGSVLSNYDEYKKVVCLDDGTYKVTKRRTAMKHRLSIGTIVSDTMLVVKYLKGGRIGTIEEWFIAKMKPGDVFWFAGRCLELHRIKDMQVIVKKTNARSSKIPSWQGGRMQLSAQLANKLLVKINQIVNNEHFDKELKTLEPLIKRQLAQSALPQQGQFLMEYLQSKEGYHLFLFPFEGRFIHEAIASLLAYRISLLKPISFSLAYNDYGLELLSDQEIPVEEILDNNLFSHEYLFDDLTASMNYTEMAGRKFRDIAVISGMVFQGFPGEPIKDRHLQASSHLIFEVFKENEPDNLLYLQAYREVFEHQMEEVRLREVLKRIQTSEVLLKQITQPSPLSFPIMVDRLREKLTSEKLEDRIKKMTVQIEKSWNSK